VFYQVYPRSFACAENPDGVGDLRGVINRLDHIVGLGVDAIWLSPLFSSPQVDHGYDVSDYFTIDPTFGTMADFDELLDAVHANGLRLLLDLVPNHTSDQHDWFRTAVAAGRGSRQRERYLFRDGRGDLPPTDVVGSFSGAPVWTRVREPDGSPGQWYFHLFSAEQPDLNWSDPSVLEGFERVWRHWLDKGVDGFRVDVADHLTKDVDRTDVREGNSLLDHEPGNRTHQVWQAFRAVLDGYRHEPTAIGEIWSDAALYSGAREFPLTFGFPLLQAGWDSVAVRGAIDEVLGRGVSPVWVIDNHDTARSATRLGSVARSRALTMVMLALPGAACIYQGQELGLPNVDDLPEEVLADPIWEGSGRADRGRDGCRVPIPWSGTDPPFGFSLVPPWLPQPPGFREYTVQGQTRSPSSTLSLTRDWVHLRRQLPELHAGPMVWLDDRPDRLHFSRQVGDHRLEVLANLGDRPIPLATGEVLAHSAPVVVDGVLPPDTAVWLRPE
jgi:alpha-glucosidase